MIKQLQIYVYGPKEEGFLDIPANTVLEMEEMGNAFDDTFSVGIFSLPVTVPWTPKNRRLLGFAERVENSTERALYFKCSVYSNGFPELVNAKMTLLGKVGTFNYNKGTFSFSIAGSKGLFGSLIQNKWLKSLTLGGPINFSTPSRDFATAVMKGSFPQYPYLKFAPVAIENFFDSNRPDYDGILDFMYKDTANYYVINGTGINGWAFGRPEVTGTGTVPVETTILTTPGTNDTTIPSYRYSDYRTIPFFSLKYVFKCCFEENGYKVAGAFVDDPAWDDLVLFNNYAIENYATPYTDMNRTILPGNHVPYMYILPFLQGVCSMFNMYPVFGDNNTVTFYYKVNDLVNKRIVDLTAKCSKEFEANYNDTNNYDNNNPANNSTGYILDYTWDSNDSYQGDRIQPMTVNLYDGTIWIGNLQLTGSVATFAALADLDPTTLTTNSLYYVEADNMFYQCANTTTIPVLWDCYAENLCTYFKGLNGNTVSIPMSTLCTYVFDNPITGLLEKQLYCGCRQLGSYINSKGVQIYNPVELRAFFIRMQYRGSVLVPISTNYNRDVNNNKISPYNLSWRGTDGLAANFHKLWQDLQIQMEIEQVDIEADQKTMTDMANSNIYEVNGIQFLPYKRERQIPASKTLQQYLIPI